MGRPSDFTQEIADEICRRLSNGESLRAICSMDQPDRDWLPTDRTVYRWLETNAEFRQQYAHAREAQADHYVDEIIAISDGALGAPVEGIGLVVTDPARDRLRVDARKWVASKLAPKKYGDKLALGGDPDAPAIKSELSIRFV